MGHAAAGTRLPDGQHLLTRADCVVWNDVALTADASDPFVDPLIAQLIVMRSDVTLTQRLLDLVDAPPGAGVMLGELDLTNQADLVADARYATHGVVTGVVQRVGRRTGPFLAVSFRHEIELMRDGAPPQPFAELAQTWIITSGAVVS